MKIKQKIITGILVIASCVSISALTAPQYAYAEPQNTAGEGTPTGGQCGEAKTAIIECDGGSGTSAKDSPIWQVLLIALNILTAGVGIAAVGGIVYAAILYSSAGDNASQTKKALEMIRDVVIGIAAFGLMYLGLNYLIPGGIFS